MLAVALVFGLGLGLGLGLNRGPTAFAQGEKRGAAMGRYTVVESEGTNLLVTDNQTNIFYFYTVDKDQPPGSDLKLRGTADLTQVGQPVIRPRVFKHTEGATKTDVKKE